jgi:hypothetical protein
MQVSSTNSLEGGRRHHSIGRVKAFSGWRATNAPTVEADRVAAVRALIREAEEYEADAIIGLDFEVDRVICADIGGALLQRVAVTGIAVRFDDVAWSAARLLLQESREAVASASTFRHGHSYINWATSLRAVYARDYASASTLYPVLA